MMASDTRCCAIAVMAKAPQPGRSKTRLCPPLSPDEAARLSAAFLRDTTENLAAAAAQAPISPYAAYAPAGVEALLSPHLAAGTGLLLADGSAPAPDAVRGFGRCLLQAVRGLLNYGGHEAACLLSSDSPTLPTRLLVEAARLLLAPGDRVVLGPADDGGYYLLGMKRDHAALFSGIDWSTERVADQTRARAREAGIATVELQPWYDVDDATTLSILMRDSSGYEAPETRRVLKALRPDVLPVIAGRGGAA